MKKVISGILGILFIVLVVVGIVVCTYVFNQPSKSGESKQLIIGNWVDEDNNVKFTFGQDGNFTMVHNDDKSNIAKGYFKIDEDKDQIKILVLPDDRDDSVNLGRNLYFFSTLSYVSLEFPEDKDINSNGESKTPATCKFLFQNSDGKVYTCTRDSNISDFYDGK